MSSLDDKRLIRRCIVARRKHEGLCYACNNPATHGIRCDVHFKAMQESRARRKLQARVLEGKE